jgi:hypothetical protein
MVGIKWPERWACCYDKGATYLYKTRTQTSILLTQATQKRILGVALKICVACTVVRHGTLENHNNLSQ